MSDTPKTKHEPRMLSIWFFVCLVLAVYGLIVLGAGIFYEMKPEAQTGKLAILNPSLLWGGVMLAASGILYLLDRRGQRGD